MHDGYCFLRKMMTGLSLREIMGNLAFFFFIFLKKSHLIDMVFRAMIDIFCLV